MIGPISPQVMCKLHIMAAAEKVQFAVYIAPSSVLACYGAFRTDFVSTVFLPKLTLV